MSILKQLQEELVKEKVALKDKIKVDKEIYDALEFLSKNGIPTNQIIEDALCSYKKKGGVVKLANDIKKEQQQSSENE